MDPVWLKSYPAGVPAEIDAVRFASLKELLEHGCDRYARHPAFTNMGVALTCGEFERLSRNFATYLQQVVGLRRCDRVAIVVLENFAPIPKSNIGKILRRTLRDEQLPPSGPPA